jgi:arylsulfatase A-like enzyme
MRIFGRHRDTVRGGFMRDCVRVTILAVILCLVTVCAGMTDLAAADTRPNVLVIITDDQGYGDLGVHGNPKIKTPNLDAFSRQSVRLEHFYVSPVCSPTRASLLTGRYNYRTGVVDTYLGRSMMHPDEVTLAEMLRSTGYRTGIFGKWHLGDNAPLRAIDQGFQQALVLKGGGIGQPSDPPGGESYFDPILQRNGREERIKGYCSDIFAQALIDFVNQPGGGPFFAYLAFNCPHAPLLAPEPELTEYRAMNLALKDFPKLGHPVAKGFDAPAENVARVYAMVTRIDSNVGKVLKALESKGIADNTIVVFLTDNGPADVRFNAGLRGRKASVYDGGIRAPCYIRWPGHFPAGGVVDRITAHIDLTPTLIDACRVAAPSGVRFDGKSLLPLLTGIQTAGWPDRTLFFQWHRGDTPELGRSFAARAERFKLVRHEPPLGSTKVQPLQLFDMERDPLELHDIAKQNPEIVSKLYPEYKAWFKDVSSTRGFEPIRIALGSPRENPTILTPQDWRGPRGDALANALGYWEVDVARSGRFDIMLRLQPRQSPSTAHITFGTPKGKIDLKPGQAECTFKSVDLPAGPGRLEAWIESTNNTRGVLGATVRRVTD